jgi:hypothetical protein
MSYMKQRPPSTQYGNAVKHVTKCVGDNELVFKLNELKKEMDISVLQFQVLRICLDRLQLQQVRMIGCVPPHLSLDKPPVTCRRQACNQNYAPCSRSYGFSCTCPTQLPLLILFDKYVIDYATWVIAQCADNAPVNIATANITPFLHITCSKNHCFALVGAVTKNTDLNVFHWTDHQETCARAACLGLNRNFTGILNLAACEKTNDIRPELSCISTSPQHPSPIQAVNLSAQQLAHAPPSVENPLGKFLQI